MLPKIEADQDGKPARVTIDADLYHTMFKAMTAMDFYQGLQQIGLIPAPKDLLILYVLAHKLPIHFTRIDHKTNRRDTFIEGGEYVHGGSDNMRNMLQKWYEHLPKPRLNGELIPLEKNKENLLHALRRLRKCGIIMDVPGPDDKKKRGKQNILVLNFDVMTRDQAFGKSSAVLASHDREEFISGLRGILQFGKPIP